MLWASGHASGAFTEEMAPVEVKTKKGPKVLYAPFDIAVLERTWL